MKALTKNKPLQKDACCAPIKTKEVKIEKNSAQCCAKNSSIITGCHD